MSQNELYEWTKGQQTPVIYNHHQPVEVNSSTIQEYNLNEIKSTRKAALNGERVLLLTPFRDSAPYLEKYFDLLTQISYPHDLIDLGFLISDTTDETNAILAKELDRIQKSPGNVPFHSATVLQRDFGETQSMNVQDRHAFEYQGKRRMLLGKVRNILLYSTLKPTHSWVYWRDADIVESPDSVIDDLIAHNKDIVVPNIMYHRYRDGRLTDGFCTSQALSTFPMLFCVCSTNIQYLFSRLQLLAGDPQISQFPQNHRQRRRSRGGLQTIQNQSQAPG